MRRIIIAVLSILIIASCTKEDHKETDKTARLSLRFDHLNQGQSLLVDSLMYINAANNLYLVSEIQYFISDVSLYKNGETHLLDSWKDIHYVDTDLPYTWDWELKDSIPSGTYDSLSVVFGINETKNQSLMFVNPPESLMFWPEYLGGGYHYLKLNGKWKDEDDVLRPYNYHLGIGQLYDETGGDPIGFVQNYFTVTLVNESFEFPEAGILKLKVDMDVDQWFVNPEIFDFNQWGGDIMQKQDAMAMAVNNGSTVFNAHWVSD